MAGCLLVAWLAVGCVDGDQQAKSLVGPAARQIPPLDECAQVWWRPERRIADRSTCSLEHTPEKIAAEGGVVAFGSFWDVSEKRTPLPGPRRCWGELTHETDARFVRAIRAAGGPGAPPVAFVHLHRFELVPLPWAALPGFDSDFLLRSGREWDAVQGFLARDRSEPCLDAQCAWSDAMFGKPEHQRGPRLRDLIDAEGGEGTYREVVYYLSSAAPQKTVYWPTAAVADLTNGAYRDWRVAEARRALEQGGYDAVMLNHKFGQYRVPHWMGSSRAPSVAAMARIGTTFFSAPPRDYGYAEYVGGWAALGRDLRKADVPYAVMGATSLWEGRRFDDPATQVDESALVRETVRGARLFLLLGTASPSRAREIVQEGRATGTRVVLRGRARAVCGVPGQEIPGDAGSDDLG